MDNFEDYVKIPRIWRSIVDYVPLEGSVVDIRFFNSKGGYDYFKCLMYDAKSITLEILKKHPEAEFCPTENVYGYWNLVTNIPQSSGYYLCKNKENSLYSVEYFDGKKFAHNESNWIRFWRDVEENLV